jgi:DNA-binding MarR family transcriptional regulator
MRCDPSFITVVADELEERGLAKRAVDADDRRVKNLVLTRKGSALRGELTQRFAEAPALQTLSGTERQTLYQLLRRMLDAAEEGCGAEPKTAGTTSAPSSRRR